MHSDPIADLLARIKNAQTARHMTVDVPHSKVKTEVLRILESEGFIGSFETITEGKFPAIRINLKYDSRSRKPVIQYMKRVSTPGLRVYRGASELRPMRGGLSTRVVTTSQGIMTDRECRRRNIGGEVLCEVW
jgi:small subunit ribosomal protein S8